MKHRLCSLLIIIQFTTISSFAQKVDWVCSTPSKQWSVKESIKLSEFDSSDKFNVEIFDKVRQQTVDGWGGCFNELGWDALMTLDSIQRNAILKEFFDPKEGLRYNLCRMPIGANDYARNWYSLNETPEDFGMKNFSIDRDKNTLIPYIKAAMKYCPDLKIWASPWSPPTWMKTNKHYANKPGDHNDLTEAQVVKYHDQFIQKKEYLAAYALYFSKFVKEYHKQGINVYAVHIQNEPFTYNQWPNCSWTAAGMKNFVTNYLGPEFSKKKVNAQIWFGTMNNRNTAMYDSVLSDQATRKYISGVGFQYEGRDVVEYISNKFPELKRMQTETPCGDASFDWKSAENTFETIQFYFDKGVNSYMYWNMILDNTGESSWGWKQNAQVIIDRATKKVTYTPEYYIFKHLSHFVVPGSVKIKLEGNLKNVLAFSDPKGKVHVIAVNTSDKPDLKTFKVGLRVFKVELPGKSFNTFSITP